MLNANKVYKVPDILKWYQLTSLILISFIIAFPFALTGSYLNAFKIILIIFVLPVWIFLLIDNRAISFYFDENKLTITKGIFFKKITSIPYTNIQNITIKSGMLLAVFDLSTIQIWTASQGQLTRKRNNDPDGRLKLIKDDAINLNEIILQKSKI